MTARSVCITYCNKCCTVYPMVPGSVRHKPVVLSKLLNGSRWFSAQRLPSAYSKCVLREFGYVQNKSTSIRKLVQRSQLSRFFWVFLHGTAFNFVDHRQFITLRAQLRLQHVSRNADPRAVRLWQRQLRLRLLVDCSRPPKQLQLSTTTTGC